MSTTLPTISDLELVNVTGGDLLPDADPADANIRRVNRLRFIEGTMNAVFGMHGPATAADWRR